MAVFVYDSENNEKLIPPEMLQEYLSNGYSITAKDNTVINDLEERIEDLEEDIEELKEDLEEITEKENMSLEELREEAKKAKIFGYKTLRKKTLLKKLYNIG